MSGECLVCLRYPPSPDSASCARCLERITEQLADIERYLTLLTPQRARRPAERSAPGFRSASPADDAVVAMLDVRTRVDGEGADDCEPVYSIPGVVTYWASVLYDAEIGDLGTVPDQVRGLLEHAEWCAAQAWAGQFADEIAALYRQLRAVCGDTPPKPLAQCFDTARGTTCDGPVYWQLTDDEAARCARCGRIYRGTALLWLKHVNLEALA